MVLKAKYKNPKTNKWIAAYVRSIKFGSKEVSVELNYGTGFVLLRMTLRVFKDKIKIIGKRLSSSVPINF